MTVVLLCIDLCGTHLDVCISVGYQIREARSALLQLHDVRLVLLVLLLAFTRACVTFAVSPLPHHGALPSPLHTTSFFRFFFLGHSRSMPDNYMVRKSFERFRRHDAINRRWASTSMRDIDADTNARRLDVELGLQSDTSERPASRLPKEVLFDPSVWKQLPVLAGNSRGHG